MPASRPVAGTLTSMSGVPLAESRWASALYVQRIVTGVAYESIVSGVAIVGRRLPAFWSFAKKSRPGWALSREPPFASAAAYTVSIACPDRRGSPAGATWWALDGLGRC